MRIILSGKNIEITEAMRERVTKKVRKLERYFDDNTEVQVTMAVEKNRHIVEVTIPFNGVVLRAEEYTDDMYATVDKVLDKLEKQIHKHRTKLGKKIRTEAFKYEKPIFSDKFDVDEQKTPKVVKTKRFAVKPMHVEEAILQMDLLGHSFFVFINAESGEANVLYKRRDGNYGLIEPEYL